MSFPNARLYPIITHVKLMTPRAMTFCWSITKVFRRLTIPA